MVNQCYGYLFNYSNLKSYHEKYLINYVLLIKREYWITLDIQFIITAQHSIDSCQKLFLRSLITKKELKGCRTVSHQVTNCSKQIVTFLTVENSPFIGKKSSVLEQASKDILQTFNIIHLHLQFKLRYLQFKLRCL